MKNGWIKLHRKILNCVIWTSKEPFCKRAAWIDLLLLANHSDKTILFNGEMITIKRGQVLTSIRALAERWHWSVNKVSRFLRDMTLLSMVIKDSDRYRTLLTIVNYEVYQGIGDSNEYTNDTPTNTVTNHKQEIKEKKNVKNNISKITFKNFDMKHDYDFDDMEQQLLK